MTAQTQIGALLHEDHMATVEMLQTLEAFIGDHRNPPSAAVGAKFLGELATTLRNEVGKHFGFEEGHLFPVFIGLGETGIVTMLTHEHRSILPLALQVADLAEQGDFDAASWKAFRDAGQELIEREIFHVQKEEMGLLAAIAHLVDPKTDAELAEIYRREVG
ncbi:MAG: hemerythrin domain-containing protein [Magnetospirillum sp.]|nr:hemerythrin domain-containing protein [Magnetospirillum sp.]